MKLYATIKSERDSREAKKGGNEYLTMQVHAGNRPYLRVSVTAGDGMVYLEGANGWRKEYTPFDLGHK